MNFIKAYVKSMRLYYAFITGISGWLGVAFYEYIANSNFTIAEFAPAPRTKSAGAEFVCTCAFLNDSEENLARG